MSWIRDLSHRVLQLTHGRTTAFFIAFFLAGHVMALVGKLTREYVFYMGTLGTLVLGHSLKEDWAEMKLGSRPPAGPDAPGAAS
jgi:hypothetical protein